MAKNNNLSDFLTDVADSIRRKKGTTEKINPQDFSSEIDNLSGGGGIDGVSVADGKLKISDTNMPIEISGSDEEIEIKYSTKQQKIKIGTYSDVYLSDETLYNVITAPNLEPQNIAKDVNILGVVGTFEGGTDTSDATATASDILVGKTAYVNDEKLEGTIETYDGENEEGEIVENSFKKYLDFKQTCKEMFYNTGISNEEVEGILEYNVTENVTDMSSMFEYAYNLTSIPAINTSKVKQMPRMFYQATKLQIAPQLDTISCTNFNQMFQGCSKLKKIDITHYGISMSAYSDNWCYSCYALKALIIRNFGETYSLAGNAFNNGFNNGYIYVPRSMVDTLKSATNWSTHADQIRALEDYTKDGTTTGEFDDAKAGLV